MSKFYFEQQKAFKALDRLMRSEMSTNDGVVENFEFHILNLTNNFAVSEKALRSRIELICRVNGWIIDDTKITAPVETKGSSSEDSNNSKHKKKGD